MPAVLHTLCLQLQQIFGRLAQTVMTAGRHGKSQGVTLVDIYTKCSLFKGRYQC